MTLLRICLTLSGSAVIAAACAVACKRRRRKSPEQIEMLRRERVCAEGRMTDGTVLEIRELDGDNGSSRQVVVYCYEIAGVQYHCAQDVTPLAGSLDLRACCLGDAASIKYDPRRPGDSIVAAESWCGLRKAHRVPARSDGPGWEETPETA